MIRLAAALEHIAAREKIELGQWIIERLQSSGAGGALTWALGRLGSRAPLVASAHKTIPPEIAVDWVTRLLRPEFSKIEGALFALAQLARVTGDRARDLDPGVRDQVLAVLAAADAPVSWRKMVTEIVELEAEDKARAFGDALPVGLSIR